MLNIGKSLFFKVRKTTWANAVQANKTRHHWVRFWQTVLQGLVDISCGFKF